MSSNERNVTPAATQYSPCTGGTQPPVFSTLSASVVSCGPLPVAASTIGNAAT